MRRIHDVYGLAGRGWLASLLICLLVLMGLAACSGPSSNNQVVVTSTPKPDNNPLKPTITVAEFSYPCEIC